MSEHTPRPWHVRFDENGGYDAMWAAYRVRASLQYICTVEVIDYLPPDEGNWKVKHSENAKARADARLIAAAPDLLAACEKFAPHFAVLRQHISGSALDALEEETRAAVAKAKGKERTHANTDDA